MTSLRRLHPAVSFLLAGVVTVLATPGTAAARTPEISIPGAPALGVNFPHWIPPIVPMIRVREYGYPKTKYSAGHRGIDLRAITGEPILAPAAGFVTFFGPTPGGISITVQSGFVKYTFQPVTPIPEDEADIVPGSPIVMGEPIALAAGVGHPGCVECVHFGVRGPSGYLDPEIFYRHHETRLITPW